jgi:signal transduction histidine kinase
VAGFYTFVKMLEVSRVTQKRIIFLLWLLLPITSFAQNRELIDSIQRLLRPQEDKKRFDLLNALAWEYRFAAPDSTIFYSEEAFRLGEKLGFEKELAQSLNYTGIGYNYKGERIKAFEYYSRALETSTRQNDTLQIAHSNNNIGRLFYEQGVLSRSYEYFVQARLLFTSLNDSSGLAYTYQSLANLYKSQRDYAKAEDNYLKAYRIRLALGNPRDIMSAYMYLGRHYQETSEHDKSIRFFKLADSTGHVINDEINLAEIKTYLAESYLSKGLLNEAEAICKEGLQVITRRNNIRMMPQAYNTMGQIFMERNDLGTARKYFIMSLDIATRIKDLNSKMDAYYSLWKVAEKQNNKNESLVNQNHYLILKDSIKDLDLTRQVERLQFEIEISRKEQENELLKVNQVKDAAVIEQQKLQNLILIVIIAFVSIVGILQWINSKKRRVTNEKLMLQNQEIQQQREEIVRQNEKLSKRNQQLSDLNHEKDTLMSIVAHDLKSPLNRIEGIIYLMEQEGSLTPEQHDYVSMVKDAMRSGLDLITDLLDVHMLEENVEPNYTAFDISSFLVEKVESFQPGAEAKKIHLSITRVENEEIHTDKDYLDRIFENLLSNAIKFSPKGSTVEISADRTEFDFWISIKDRGPGFSTQDKGLLFQKFKKLSARPTAGETSNGLGLAIVKILVDRLKGKIDLVSEQGRGSQFTVRFPQQKQII